MRESNNQQLYGFGLSIDHDFVISDASNRIDTEILRGRSCEPGQPSTPDQLVIDPLVGADAHQPQSLEQIVLGLQPSSPRVLLLRSGIHHLSSPLMITAASGALVIRACPGDTPVIDAPVDGPAIIMKGSKHAAVIGLLFSGSAPNHLVMDGAEDCIVERNTFLNGTVAITLNHARRNQILANVIRDAASTGIELKDGSDANLVAGNVVDGASAPETFGGGVFLHGANGNRVAHNVIQRTTGFGIGVMNWDDTTINIDNVLEYNLLRRTVLNSSDSGAIYILGRSGADTNTVIASNVIDGFGSPGNHNVGIYLDDSTNGAMVIGNLVRGVGSDAVQIHGGQDNRIENNLLDLGAGRPSALLFQAAPADTHPLNRQTGNVVSRNVILSSNLHPRPFIWYDGGHPEIAGNFYVVPDDAVISEEVEATDRKPRRGRADLLPAANQADYRPVQAEAEQIIGFRPVDLSAAGPQRRLIEPRQ